MSHLHTFVLSRSSSCLLPFTFGYRLNLANVEFVFVFFVCILKDLSVFNGPCMRQKAEGQVAMWPFQNQQVWTGPLSAERASWCLISAAFNDGLSAESSSSDNLCANLPLWRETQVVTLPFAPCECWQSCYYKLKLQKVIFSQCPSTSVQLLKSCLQIHVPTNAVTLSTAFMCVFAVGFSF